MSDAPDGYQIDLFTALTQPILLGGAPRTFAILNGTATVLVCLPLGLPWIGLPFGIASHAMAVYLTKRDPHFFEILLRHLRQRHYWD
jgi:type IV secretory pathway TrbD component